MNTNVALVGVDLDLAIELLEQVESLKLHYVDTKRVENLPSAMRYLGNDEDFKVKKYKGSWIFGLDNPDLKILLYENFLKEKHPYKFVSQKSSISASAKIGLGCVVQSNVYISGFVQIGMHCKVNVGAQIHHGVKVSDFCTIAPQALLLGDVEVSKGAYIGAGAIIKQKVRVGAGAIVGAGAVVTRDVEERTTVTGVPARP